MGDESRQSVEESPSRIASHADVEGLQCVQTGLHLRPRPSPFRPSVAPLSFNLPKHLPNDEARPLPPAGTGLHRSRIRVSSLHACALWTDEEDKLTWAVMVLARQMGQRVRSSPFQILSFCVLSAEEAQQDSEGKF